MRRSILLLVSLIALACAVAPAAASAATSPPPDVEAPMFLTTEYQAVPPGFAIDPSQAIAIAKTSPRMEAIHRAQHPLKLSVLVWIRDHYEIYFYFHGKPVADQLVGLPASSARPIPGR